MEHVIPNLRDPAVDEFDTRTLMQNAAEQARKRHYEDFLIVDSDAHHYEMASMHQITQYIESPVLRQLASGRGAGKILSGTPGFQDVGGRVPRYSLRDTEKVPPAPPHRDVTLTRRWMDAMGTDMICLFPTPMLQLGLHPQIEVEVALARAYNRWLVENVLSAEPRIRSMLYLPFNDPVASHQMVKDFGDKKGVAGFVVTSVRYKAVNDNAFVPTYALMEEMGLPLAFHAGYNWYDQSFAVLNRFISAHALGFSFFNMIHMANWVVNGMNERFPKLKVIWIESGLAWVPFMMQRFDNEYLMRTSECPALKKLPSDYMRDMYYTSQPMEMVNNKEALELTFKMINAETQLLYASDYPHWDMDLPSTIYDLPFLSEQAKRNILGGNAQKVFGFEPIYSDWKLAARKEKEMAAAKSA